MKPDGHRSRARSDSRTAASEIALAWISMSDPRSMESLAISLAMNSPSAPAMA
jgi:hypothetical protein